MNPRAKILLYFVVGLLVIKFILQPAIVWQDDTIERLSIEYKRLEKLKVVSNNIKGLTEQISDIQAKLSKQETLFFKPQVDDRFKLTQQKILEEGIISSGLVAQRIGWAESIDMDGIIQHRAELDLIGTFQNFIEWHLALEKQIPFVNVGYFSIRKSGRSKKEQQNITAKVILHLYMSVDGENP